MTYLEWPRRVAALGQFHVENVGRPVLDKDNDHHLRKVLRAQDAEEIVVTNGHGSWALARVTPNGLALESDVHVDPTPNETIIYLTPLKGDRSEWAVAKATEVGITRIVPLIAGRMAVKFKGEAREKILSRWKRVAAEAAGQSRRTYDVIIDEPVKVADVPSSVAVAQFAGSGNWGDLRSVAIGPEGGWASDEWEPTRRLVGLGPSVLRAETAGIVAASLLAFQAGGWGFTLNGPQSE